MSLVCFCIYNALHAAASAGVLAAIGWSSALQNLFVMFLISVHGTLLVDEWPPPAWTWIVSLLMGAYAVLGWDALPLPFRALLGTWILLAAQNMHLSLAAFFVGAIRHPLFN